MAASKANLHKTGIFWINDVSDEEQPLAFVPGVNRGIPFVSAPHSSNKGRTRQEQAAVKRQTLRSTPRQRERGNSGGHKLRQRECSGGSSSEKVPLSTLEDQTARGPNVFLQLSQVERERSHISLKDLCPEDKKRIANLIQELARVSEEKEESVQRFLDEQGQFEQKILELEAQNLIIAKERERLQQQYKECQELMGLYQLYLKEQQDKLDSQMRAEEASHSSTYGCADKANRTNQANANLVNGSVCDGSYLSLAPAHGHQAHFCPTTHHATVPQPQLQHLLSNHHPTAQYHHPTAALHSQVLHPQVLCPQHLHNSAPPSAPHPSAGHVTSDAILPVSTGACQCHQPKPKEALYSRDPSTDADLGPDSGYETQPMNKTCNKHQRSTAGSSSLGLESQDWDQRKNQLLMQKIQLEEERERLQRRLSEQEQRRSKEEQKRSQEESSQHNRFADPKLASPAETGPLPSQTPSASRHAMKNEQKEGYAQEHSTEETSFRRDMDTSQRPLASPETRLDLSLSELLEIFSPVCPSSKQRSTTCRPKAALQPPHSSFRNHAPLISGPTPFRSHTPLTADSHLDLEESRILEDIFFIL